MSRHRADPVRPRWGRISALAASLAVTAVAVLGGVGLGPEPEPALAEEPAAALTDATAPSSLEAPESRDAEGAPSRGSAVVRDRAGVDRVAAPALPEGSGSGRRAVFDQSEQRVWLVSRSGRVASTYLVSGSVTDNLRPGTYEVFSRSEDAVGIDGSTMRWFVRFTRGPSGAAIGFHDLPVEDGRVVQDVDQLGTAQSHGCIRQRTSDARRMWRFAPLGTTVVVTA